MGIRAGRIGLRDLRRCVLMLCRSSSLVALAVLLLLLLQWLLGILVYGRLLLSVLVHGRLLLLLLQVDGLRLGFFQLMILRRRTGRHGEATLFPAAHEHNHSPNKRENVEQPACQLTRHCRGDGLGALD